MGETQRFGMKRLARYKSEGIVDKGFKRTIRVSPQQPVAPVHGIVEKWVTNVFEMRPNLVRPARFELALHQRYKCQRLQGSIVCYCPFPLAFVVVDSLYLAVFHTSANVAGDGSINWFGNAPDERIVGTLDGMVKKLAGQ